MFEPNDLERLLLDDHFLGLAMAEEGEDAGPRALARWVADIEAGRAQLPPGWKLSRERAGTVIWIAPSGERYVATLPKLPSRNRPSLRRGARVGYGYLEDFPEDEEWLDPAERDYYFGDSLYDEEEDDGPDPAS